MTACEFHGCERPLAPEQPAIGMKLCAEHDAEFTALAVAEDYAGLLAFFIHSHGGAQVLAHELVDQLAASDPETPKGRLS